MADFEDAHSPTWEATMDGQVNARDAVNRTISYTSPDGKEYRLKSALTCCSSAPRGWHLPEKHPPDRRRARHRRYRRFRPVLLHNAKNQLARGTGPYFYLPKMQSHLEARLWNGIFNDAQDALGIARGTIKSTVLVETLWAAFEMDEILFELKDHIVALNCGRWTTSSRASRRSGTTPTASCRTACR